MQQNLSSAAVVIATLRVKQDDFFFSKCMIFCCIDCLVSSHIGIFRTLSYNFTLTLFLLFFVKITVYIFVNWAVN